MDDLLSPLNNLLISINNLLTYDKAFVDMEAAFAGGVDVDGVTIGKVL